MAPNKVDRPEVVCAVFTLLLLLFWSVNSLDQITYTILYYFHGWPAISTRHKPTFRQPELNIDFSPALRTQKRLQARPYASCFFKLYPLGIILESKYFHEGSNHQVSDNVSRSPL